MKNIFEVPKDMFFFSEDLFIEASESEDPQKVFFLEITKGINKLHLERSSLAENGTTVYLPRKKF